jgi:hypothetical protein
MSNGDHPSVAAGDELYPMNAETRIAVMSVQMGHISETLSRIEQNSLQNVPRTEWEQRNAYVNGKLVEAAQMVSDVKAEIAGRRAPWWAVIASIAGATAVVAYLIEIIPRLVN